MPRPPGPRYTTDHSVNPDGTVDMRLYVELGCPFRIDVKTNDGNSIGMSLSQTDRDCATISLQVETL